jgi:hypothetical protein
MTAQTKAHNLKVVLDLKWVQGNEYEAKVSVTITDSCYHPGEIKIGLPPGEVGIPEVEYITFSFTHDEGRVCSDITKAVDKTIRVPFSAAKPKLTAFAVVNGRGAGSDTKTFPRK